jgi:hypothetical protein
MKTDVLRHASITAAVMLSVISFGAWVLTVPTARAVPDTSQLITGGATTIEGPGVTRFTAPGFANVLTADFPATGLGEQAAAVRMTAGTLSKFRASVTTASAPSGGTFTLMVRVNGADTPLTCSVTGTGTCSAGNKVRALNNSAVLAVRIVNDLDGGGNVAFTYSMLLD